MLKALRDLRPVYVVGIGLHRYQRASEASFVELGLRAVREALTDAAVKWSAVDSAYTGTVLLGAAASRIMLRHLGATGIPMAQIENASASGSTAFRQACYDVASGVSDVALALGVDKPEAPRFAFVKAGVSDLVAGRMLPVTHFALLANEYMWHHGVSAEEVAQVAVKNSTNGATNPFAHRQKARTLEEVMEGPALSGSLTRLQCCPIGEGAAAVLVASEDAIDCLAIDGARTVQVLASVLRSERVYPDAHNFDAELTAETTALAYEQAGIGPEDLDVVELHDAFTIEELLYVEAMGLCPAGDAVGALERGETDIGGRCAVSPSGGLLAMGHPLGPTGIGQIAEITRQLRREAGVRQQPGARIGLAHMVGLGAVCAVHVLAKAGQR